MGEQEDREKAEKLAAAKKRVAQLKKKKVGAAADKATTSSEKKTRPDTSATTEKANVEESQQHEEPDLKTLSGLEQKLETDEAAEPTTKPDKVEIEPDADQLTFNETIAASRQAPDILAEQGSDGALDSSSAPPNQRHQARQPSISVQSKIRSTSFRQSIPASSQPSESASDDSLYRKQVSRIEELERENLRLVKAAEESEARWRKTEEELEELHDRAPGAEWRDSELVKLQSEIEVLRRNSRSSASTGSGRAKELGVSAGTDSEYLRKELEGKDTIISDLQVELSRLRVHASTQAEGCETHGEQIAALHSNSVKSEATVKRLEAELDDSKKALARASEKAVVDGTEKTSSQTRLALLQNENEGLRRSTQELEQKVDTLEKKIEAMSKLHRETEQRNNIKTASLESQLRDLPLLRSKAEAHEKENARLKEARKHTLSGEGGDDGLEELEDEERKRLERRIRELEAEVFDLRRGVWRDKRRELQPGMVEDGTDDFDDIDLSGSAPASRRRSTASQGFNRQHSGFTQVLNSGLAAFRSSTISPDPQHHGRPRSDSLLQEFDDDAFDEHEFARQQREEEMKNMVEHVRDVKRGLKKWVGWRLDLVDARRGGGGWGVGEVFDI